uniref:BPTI/Kunitz inhibitor domain-containing protein n=1 Tax=Pseudonaja textilis TaxID=8673 RepID=A0A670ZPC9_PSETE
MLPIRPSWAEPVVKKKLRQSAERRKERKAQAFLFFLLSADWRCRPRPVWGIALVHDYQTGSATVETVLGFLLCFPEDCELPPDKGPADNLELRWFHNSKSKRCERFFYGGCYGNANNYKDINECDRFEVFPFVPCNNTCSDDRDCRLTEKCCFTGCSRGCLPSGVSRPPLSTCFLPPLELPLSPSLPVRSDQCQLPRNQGSCSKELQHFYYDPEEKKCISFVYHGCEGNSNNFPTRELCEKACGKISKGTQPIKVRKIFFLCPSHFPSLLYSVFPYRGLQTASRPRSLFSIF